MKSIIIATTTNPNKIQKYVGAKTARRYVPQNMNAQKTKDMNHQMIVAISLRMLLNEFVIIFCLFVYIANIILFS